MISFSSTKFAANRRPNGRRFRSVTTAPRRGNATKSVGVFAGKTLPPAAPTTFFFLFYPPPPPTSPLRVWEEKKKKKKKKRKKKSSFPHLALQRRSTRRERPSETVGPRFRPVTFFFRRFFFSLLDCLIPPERLSKFVGLSPGRISLFASTLFRFVLHLRLRFWVCVCVCFCCRFRRKRHRHARWSVLERYRVFFVVFFW